MHESPNRFLSSVCYEMLIDVMTFCFSTLLVALHQPFVIPLRLVGYRKNF